MDPAVAIVQAYLRTNGYFTVAEYPIVRRDANGHYQSMTDVDVLAVRFPGARFYVPDETRSDSDLAFALDDPALSHEDDQIEILIGEVKEGRAELNRGARDPGVIRAALLRFGIVRDDEIGGLIKDLHDRGEAVSADGYRVRLFAFGTYVDRPTNRYKVVLLKHIFAHFKHRLLDEYSDMLGAAQFKDPAMGLLMVAVKAGAFEPLDGPSKSQ